MHALLKCRGKPEATREVPTLLRWVLPSIQHIGRPLYLLNHALWPELDLFHSGSTANYKLTQNTLVLKEFEIKSPTKSDKIEALINPYRLEHLKLKNGWSLNFF